MNDLMLIEIYINRFINRPDKWGRQWINRERTRYGYAHQSPEMDTKGGRYLFEPVTPKLVHRHLTGQLTCAWSATDSNGSSKWLCFDSDVADGALDTLDAFLVKYGWHVIREGRRPGRDGHLWLLFNKPVPAIELVVLGIAMMKLAGINRMECFPKTATGFSQVRGPLGINLKPEANGARGWFDGVEQHITSQLEWLAAQPLNRAEDAIREAHKQRPVSTPTRRSVGRVYPKLSKGFSVLNYVQARNQGGALVAQCPLCAHEGHDKHQDNLRITSDGSIFCCVYGGPNQVHKIRDIMTILVRERSA
ncbi:hypothetical protein BH10CYA1_BH10CYA1_58480 [soil metagenome]